MRSAKLGHHLKPRTARSVVFPQKKVSNVILDDVFDTWRRGLVVNETSKGPGASSVIFFIFFLSLSLFKKFFFSLFTWSPRSFGLQVFTCILIFLTKTILTDRQFYFLLLPMDLYETHNFEWITGLPSIEKVNSQFFLSKLVHETFTVARKIYVFLAL